MDALDRSNELDRLYRIICEAELKEAAEIMRDIYPHLRSYDATRNIIAAHKSVPA